MAVKFFNKTMQEDFEKISELQKHQAKERFELAERIRELLNSKGLSQKSFAELIDRNESEVSKWLTGFHNFTQDTISLIEFYLKSRITKPEVVKETRYVFALKPGDSFQTEVIIDEQNIGKLEKYETTPITTESYKTQSMCVNN